MALTRIAYRTIRYVFTSTDVTGSGFRLLAAENIPEGSVVRVDAQGRAALCGLADVPIGVARFPAAAGTQLTIEKFGQIRDYATTGAINLTVGARVYTAAGGTVSSTATGATQVGVAISATEAVISL